MNQILNDSFFSEKNNINKIKNLKILFWFFLMMFIVLFIILIYFRFNKLNKENYSKDLINSYEITTLYNSNISNYEIIETSYNNEPFVIGLIEIKKINIIYPILSTTTDELLEIAPCKFYGPMPNNIGNLCIAGHNYLDNKIFGKLYLIDIGDIINIYDLNGDKVSYSVYDKTDVEATDLSCLNQNTNGFCEITLITCNTINKTRHIIKAKENR